MNLNVLSGLPATADGTETGLTALSLDDAGLSASFAQLLGERFTPEGQLKGKPNVAQLLAEDPQISTLSRQQLNQLLTSFSDRGRLLAAPQELDTADDSQTRLTKRDDEQPLHPVDTLDTASLQALFAMLPANVVQSLPGNGVATAAEPNGDETPLTGAASLLATLSENPRYPLPVCQRQNRSRTQTINPPWPPKLTRRRYCLLRPMTIRIAAPPH